MSNELESLLNFANYVFVSLYVIEFFMKLLGLGLKGYYLNDWNKFDFIVLVFSIVTLVELPFTSVNTSVIRALRIVRIFRLAKALQGIKKLFKALFTSLPSLANVGTLLLLLYFIYAVAGMSLFGKIRHGDFINKHANFETFYNSMITLFRASTGESWNGLMRDCFGTDCSGDNGECGNPMYAVIFWVSFTTITAFVFLNIFVAVIIDIFETDKPKINMVLTK